MERGTLTIKVVGRAAVIAMAGILLCVPFIGWLRFHAASNALPDVENWVRKQVIIDHVIEIVPEMKDFDSDSMSRADLSALKMKLFNKGEVGLTSLDVRGSVFGTMILRIEFNVNGKTLSGGGVRYYSLDHSLLFGWMSINSYPTYPIFWHLAPWR